jgi:molecular chaperone GrpE
MGGHDDAADIALAAVDELADRATEIESLRQELESSQEQLLRNAAEFQNYRRRTEQEKAQLVGLGKTLVIQQFLDIVDDFQRSLEAAEQVERNDSESGSAYRALKEGVDLVYRKFVDELTKLGVQPIEAVGRPFDENEHEAMMQQPDTDAAPGTVIEELQKGYRMGDRILRHAKVIVAA